MRIKLFKYAYVIYFLILNGILLSQNETSKWYFGTTAGLDFMSSPPTILTNGVQGAPEGCSSISDASGNILMYTNGFVVVNRLHQVMANGGALAGDLSSAQSCLIVKQPGNTNIYFIFTTHQFGSTPHSSNYSIVDMNLAAGNGSVTVKNATLFANSSEKLTAVRHCNGTDLWIITQDRLLNTFRAYLLTAAGVSSAPVVSSTPATDIGSGYLKPSISGRKLGMTNYADTTFTGPPAPFSFALFDFDYATGIVSNAVDLGFTTWAYGCEFSPDETKFYASDLLSIHQWNLCAGSGAAIAASRYDVHVTTDSLFLIAALQLAKDGKIYVARTSKTALGVINAPNLAGSSCNFIDTSQSIAPRICQGGLPNFMPLYKPVIPSFTTTVNSAVSCNTATFNALPLVSCPYSGYISSMVWSFDDVASGSANTATVPNPVHVFSFPGVYTVRLILYNQCGVAIDTLKQQLPILHIPITSASAFSLCPGNTLTLSAGSGFTNYQWSNGATTTSITVTPSMTTAYTLTATDAYHCNYQSVQTVTVNPNPVITISGNTFVCSGSAVTQTASGAVQYSWTTGQTGFVVSLTPSANIAYTVTGTDANGCRGTASSGISLIETPSLTVNSATVCGGNTTMITAVSADPLQVISYTWLPGMSGGSVITVTGSFTQVYTVIGSISTCSTTATSTLTVITPSLTIRPSLTITPGTQITLQASGGESYSWTPPEYLSCTDCSDPAASPPGDINYCVTIFQGSCTATGCLTISVGCADNGDFSLPNAFTPNGDHNNDEFCLHGWECTGDFNIKIFDRWGEKVFESQDPGFCWDGVYKDKPLGSAVFVYAVSAQKKDKERISKKGTITLLR